MFKLSVLQRMTITAMMLAFYVIATRYIMVPITPGVRLSAGVSILIFSSIFLGPISGSVIGVAGDLIGHVINPYSANLNPLLTICYGLMGLTPALLIMLFKKVKGKDLVYSISFFVLLFSIFIALTTYTSISDGVELFNRYFSFTIAAKVLIPIIALILLGSFAVFTYFLNKRFKKRREENPNLPSPYQVSFIVVIIEVVFTLFINVFAKKLFLPELPIELIILPSLLISIIYLFGNTIIVTYLCFLAVKTVRIRE